MSRVGSPRPSTTDQISGPNIANKASCGLTYFSGGSTAGDSVQKGFMSAGFETDKDPWDTSFKEDDSCFPADITGLPEIFDSFQTIPYSLMSSLETLQSTIHPSHSPLRQTSNPVNQWGNNRELLHVSEQREHFTFNKTYSRSINNSFDLEGLAPEINNLQSTTDHNVPVFADVRYTQLHQAPQGGSGKLSFVPVIENAYENNDDDDIQNNQTNSPILNPQDFFQHSDDPNGRKRNYAAFLCCAPQDMPLFGISFHILLETWGFRIFLPPRDSILTECNFDNMFRALDERCNGKIIVVLSVNYKSSKERSFMTSFARLLDPDSRKRNIIPVQIDKNVHIPNEFKALSIIRYTQDYKSQWLKKKLVEAIAA
ncbi:hypothetical protein Btru_035092 [Bulinus truncatus]|nr:hypothetical protein Btru_035092 [Bulinus truncatus]